MRSQTSGPLTAVLMFVPLVVVPLLAVFGIPQFAPVAASSSGDKDEFKVDNGRMLGMGESARRSSDDLFSPFPSGDSTIAGSSTTEADDGFGRSWDDPFRDPEPERSQQSGRNFAPRAEPRRIPPVDALGGWEADNKSEKPLTWRSAVQQLNALGIRDFRLEPGESEHEFHFSCFLTPSENPRITHRFEAEAAEPLRAVQKVLLQVEQWLRQR